MASRTSSTRSLLTSIDRLLMTCSTQAVAVLASSGLKLASRHSGPCPVNRSSLLILLVLPVFKVLAFFIHDVEDDVIEVFVDGFELVQYPGFFPDGVQLDGCGEIDLPCRG